LRGLLGVAHPTDLETDRYIGRLQALQRQEALSPAETAELESLQSTVRQTLFAAAFAEPAVVARAAKAKVPKKPREKRAAGKSATTSTARRSSRAKQ
jgi:hypothetical protein